MPGDGSFTERGRAEPFAPPRLVRRIDVDADLGEGLPGRRISLTGVLLYDHQVEVRTTINPGIPEGAPLTGLYRPLLSDDAGTAYEEQSGGYLETPDGPSSSHRTFRPAVPAHARVLRIGLADGVPVAVAL